MAGLSKQKIGLIGVGNMGTSILDGVLHRRFSSPKNIWVYDKAHDKARSYARRQRVHLAVSCEELFLKVNVVLLAIKPQDFPEFASENKHLIQAGQCVISILAGMTTEGIRKALGPNVRVVRAMPNLGAQIGQSMTAICGKDRGWLSIAQALFSGCGSVVTLPEKQMDLVTAMSGSGPAYFFYMMELMTAFGVQNGLSEKTAAALAVQTGVGAALLAKASEFSCSELRKRVTSKKGTTEAALQVLQQKQFGKIFQQALQAAVNRSRALRLRKKA